eukprot:TRINITY_DN39774_c0_g2_i1.p1 TRINITY_DN39774_c0_g2~~TRINITY_DN39774_c0_g2_i1.p1  ORF type:complete len:178 (+),score=48.68 TRINITY_DN39774_c0_g2_i1:127-660(+)
MVCSLGSSGSELLQVVWAVMVGVSPLGVMVGVLTVDIRKLRAGRRVLARRRSFMMFACLLLLLLFIKLLAGYTLPVLGALLFGYDSRNARSMAMVGERAEDAAACALRFDRTGAMARGLWRDVYAGKMGERAVAVKGLRDDKTCLLYTSDAADEEDSVDNNGDKEYIEKKRVKKKKR